MNTNDNLDPVDIFFNSCESRENYNQDENAPHFLKSRLISGSPTLEYRFEAQDQKYDSFNRINEPAKETSHGLRRDLSVEYTKLNREMSQER